MGMLEEVVEEGADVENDPELEAAQQSRGAKCVRQGAQIMHNTMANQ